MALIHAKQNIARKQQSGQQSVTSSGGVDYAKLGISPSQSAAIEKYRRRIGDYDWVSSYKYDPFDDEDSARMAQGVIPKSLQKTYKNTAVDNALFVLGLPSQSKIESIAKKAEDDRETRHKQTIAAEKRKAEAQEKKRNEEITNAYNIEERILGIGADGASMPTAGGTPQTTQSQSFRKDPNGYLPTPVSERDAAQQDEIQWNAAGIGTDTKGRKYTKNPLTGEVKEVSDTESAARLDTSYSDLDPGSMGEDIADDSWKKRSAADLIAAGVKGYSNYVKTSEEKEREEALNDTRTYQNPLASGVEWTVDNTDRAERIREEELQRRNEQLRKNREEARRQEYYSNVIPSYADYDGQAAQGAEMALPLAQRQGKPSVLDLDANPYEYTKKYASGENALINYMTDDERKTWDYLRAAQGEEAAQRYWDYIAEGLETRWTQNENERLAQYAAEDPFGASAQSIAMGLPAAVKGIGYIIGQEAKGEEINPQNSAFALGIGKETLRGTVSEGMENTGKFFYDTLMSAADNLFGMATTGAANLGFITAGAFSEGVRSAKEAGADNNTAVKMGVVSGLAEYLTEKAGFDRITEAFGDATGGHALRQAFVAALKAAVPEGMEEMASETANTLADILIMQDKGEVSQTYNQYLASGMTEKEALDATVQGIVRQVMLSGAGGAVSGALLSGGGALLGGSNFRNQDAISETVAEEATGNTLEPEISTQSVLENESSLEQIAPYAEQDSVQQDVAQQNVTVDNLYSGLLNELSQTRFSPYGISDTVRKTIGKSVKLNGNTDVSAKYAELSQRFPGLFPSDVSGAENQLGQISRAIRLLKSGSYVGADSDIRSNDLIDRNTQNAAELNEVEADIAGLGSFLEQNAAEAEAGAFDGAIPASDVTPEQLNALNARLDEIDAALDTGVDDLRLEMERAYIMEMLDGTRPVDMRFVSDNTETSEPEDYIASGGGLTSQPQQNGDPIVNGGVRQQAETPTQKRRITQENTVIPPTQMTQEQTDNVLRWQTAIEKSGAKDPGMQPHNGGVVPNGIDGQKVSDALRTMYTAPSTTEEMQAVFRDAALNGTLGMYTPKSLKQVTESATKRYAGKDHKQAATDFRTALDAELNGTSKRSLEVKAEDIAYAAVIYEQALAADDMETAQQIAADVASIMTEAGRTVNAMKLFKLTSSEGRYSVYVDQAKAAARDVNRKRRKGEERLTIEIPSELKNAYIKADNAFKLEASDTNNTALESAKKAIVQYIAEQVPLSFRQKLEPLRHLNMLGNLKTHLRNTAGNVFMRGQVAVRNKISGVLQDVILNDLSNQTATLRNGNRQAMDNRRSFAAADYAEMKDILMGNGGTYSQMVSEIQQERQRQAGEKNTLLRTLYKLSNVNDNLLNAEDEIFLSSNYRAAMINYMRAQNLTAADMKNDTLSNARAYAVNEALKATYRDDSRVATILSQLGNANFLTQMIVEGTMPYKKTPVNVAKRAMEYSPLGLGKAAYQYATRNTNDYSGSQIVNSLSEGLTGTGLALAGYFLAQAGLLRGAGNEDEDENYYEQSLGKQNFSLTIGGHYYTIDWISPTSIPLFIGARISDMVDSGSFWGLFGIDEESSFADNVGNVLSVFASVFDPIFEMSCMSGLQDALEDALNRNADQNFWAALAVNASTGYLSQYFSNSALRHVARVVDPVRRDTTYSSNANPYAKALDKQVNQIINGIPFVSQSLPAYIDNNGQEERTYTDATSFVGNAFQQMVSPGWYDKYSAQPVDEERLRLNEEYEAGVQPDYISGKITYDGTSYQMTPEERNDYKTTYGRIQSEFGNDVIATQGYRNAGNKMQMEILKKLGAYATSQAKIRFLRSRDIDVDTKNSAFRNAAKADMAMEQGIPLGDFFATQYVYTQLKGEIKDPVSGKTVSGAAWSRTEDYMRTLGLTEKQMEYMQEVLK